MFRPIQLVAAALLALSATLVGSTAGIGATPAPDYQAIDAYVSRSLAGAPGVALAIVHGDQVTHVRGFGTAGGDGAQVTADTPFVIGSQTKSFTALAIMQLSESGLLDLDAPVQRYLPWFRVADPGYSARITVRQLLNQTSGLPRSAPFDTPVTSVTQRVRDLATVSSLATPGQVWAYSNSNYDVLGLVIEALSGQSYGDYVEQHIFAPLDMQQSFASESQAQQHGLAVGHQWWFGLTIPVDTYRADYVPDGYLLSSVSDMSHYLIAQLQGGTYNGNRVLSQAGVDQMHTGVVETGRGGSYGMGWVQEAYNGTTVISHDGDTLNMHSEMILVPALGWGVELIVNSSSVPVLMTASVDATARGVVSMLMGSAAPSSLSPIATYLALDAVALVMVAFLLWSLVRASRARVSPVRGFTSLLRHVVLPFGWRLALAVVAVGVIGLLAQASGASFQLMAGTDFGVTLLVVAGLLLVNAVVRVARRVSVVRQSPRPAQARTSDPSFGLTVRS
jgi:CubicO group peptidase (beta-lactamase class C family)